MLLCGSSLRRGEQRKPGKKFPQSVRVKRQIFRDGEADDIRMFGDAVQHVGQFLKRHLPSAGTVSGESRIGEVGGVKTVFVQHVDVKMDKRVFEPVQKSFDFIVRNEFILLDFVSNAGYVQKFFLMGMERLQSDVQNFIPPESGIFQLVGQLGAPCPMREPNTMA